MLMRELCNGFLEKLQIFSQHKPENFIPFMIGDVCYGHLRKDKAAFFMQLTDVFAQRPTGLHLLEIYKNFSERTEALAQAVQLLAAQQNLKLRNELYPVVQQWGNTPQAVIDRLAVPWFGIHGFGVHVSGYVRRKGELFLWIAERSADRLVDPGKLDNLIGGGQPYGLTIEENLAKEAYEEAGIGKEVASRAILSGQMSYKIDLMGGLRNDTLFGFDLELEENFVPHNTDGEVQAFHLMPLDEVARIVSETDKFKFNCNLVIIDFLVRYGFFESDLVAKEKICEILADFKGEKAAANKWSLRQES